MHRSSDVIRPKTKVSVLLKWNNGSNLEGYVYVSGQERILDLVNDGKLFLPFETNEGKVLLINKNTIDVIEPFDEERMASSHSAPPIMQPSASAKRKKI